MLKILLSCVFVFSIYAVNAKDCTEGCRYNSRAEIYKKIAPLESSPSHTREVVLAIEKVDQAHASIKISNIVNSTVEILKFTGDELTSELLGLLGFLENSQSDNVGVILENKNIVRLISKDSIAETAENIDLIFKGTDICGSFQKAFDDFASLLDIHGRNETAEIRNAFKFLYGIDEN